MNIKNLLIFIFFGLCQKNIFAQDLSYPHKIIAELCNENMFGRGYVNDGALKAANYLENQFAILKLKKYKNTYIQTYNFDVNTHPYPIECKLDNIAQKTGENFIVSASATSLEGSFKLLFFNTKDSLDDILLQKKIEKGFEQDEALVLRFSSKRNNAFIDSLKKYRQMPKLIIFTEEKKLTHTIATQTDDFNSIVFIDSIINSKEKIQIDFKNKFETQHENKNLIGYIKGKKQDSTIVFSAHYDHLGMQGNAMFPGASDNASGTSMVLYLAKYFSTHKPPCNIFFILFSGEEAGLLGSKYFTDHPTFDIRKIKMLINIDIMGSAENGITVVNGEVFKEKFERLKNINLSKKYLPEVHIRGKAKNSDHYYFSEKGISSFFIYSMGGAGFYHDIFDKANTVTLTHYDDVAKLLIDFVWKL